MSPCEKWTPCKSGIGKVLGYSYSNIYPIVLPPTAAAPEEYKNGN